MMITIEVKADTLTGKINLAGLVVDTENLLPVPSAAILDASGAVLGHTDEKGYFKVSLPHAAHGEIYFKLTVQKNGFKSMTATEHWGDFQDSVSAHMYFALKKPDSPPKSFYKHYLATDLDYDNVLANFAKASDKKALNERMEAAKSGNEDALIYVDGTYYIVSNSAWVDVASVEDQVSIDGGERIVKVKDINTVVKKSDIRSMTPVTGPEGGVRYAITTQSQYK